MDQKAVSNLEREIEQAISDVVINRGVNRLPLLPSRQIMHLMAKAAVSVYEAAVESSDQLE